MNNSKLIITMIILLLAFPTAQAADDVHSSEKGEFGFGKSDLTYRVDEGVDKLKGKDVVNEEGDTIGTVDNFLISDPENIQYAIISVGGFLGIGEKLVAIPVKHLQLNEDKEEVTLKGGVTEEDLKNAPAFEYEKAETGSQRFPQYGPDQH